MTCPLSFSTPTRVALLLVTLVGLSLPVSGFWRATSATPFEPGLCKEVGYTSPYDDQVCQAVVSEVRQLMEQRNWDARKACRHVYWVYHNNAWDDEHWQHPASEAQEPASPETLKWVKDMSEYSLRICLHAGSLPL
jgi:hypothetical protein